MIAPSASYLQIQGTGQIELFGDNGQSRVVETGNLAIQTDGKLYHISIVSKGNSNLPNDVYDVTADYGCDGQDIFVLSDRLSPLHRTHAGLAGFAYSGRFPYMDEFPPSVVLAAWLAYCSSDYFNVLSNQNGFELGNHPMTLPGLVTNLPTYWPNSTLPQSITGWSRNWWVLPRTNSLEPMQTVELKQYPNGFKAWKFTASDPVMVGNIRVPRQSTLETFFPKPPNTATTGDETMLLRRATFTADSIETVRGRLNPFPRVPVPDLQVMDWRFEDVAGPFVITSHASPKGMAGARV